MEWLFLQWNGSFCNGSFSDGSSHPSELVEEKLFTIIHRQADVALLAGKLANGGSIDHFIVSEEFLSRATLTKLRRGSLAALAGGVRLAGAGVAASQRRGSAARRCAQRDRGRGGDGERERAREREREGERERESVCESERERGEVI